MSSQYRARVTVAGKRGRYTVSVVAVDRPGPPPPPPWELHYGDSIVLELGWEGEPQPPGASLAFTDVNITRPGEGDGPFPGHTVEGIRSTNGKYHDPSQSWQESPGPGWWGTGPATTVEHLKDKEWVKIYEIGPTQEKGNTEAVIRDCEVLEPGLEDCYFFSGRVQIVADGKGTVHGGGVPFDPEMVNKGPAGRRRRH